MPHAQRDISIIAIFVRTGKLSQAHQESWRSPKTLLYTMAWPCLSQHVEDIGKVIMGHIKSTTTWYTHESEISPCSSTRPGGQLESLTSNEWLWKR